MKRKFPEEHPRWDPHADHRPPNQGESDHSTMVGEFLEMVRDYQIVACVMQLGCAAGCNPSEWGLEGAACWLARVFDRPRIIENVRDVMRRENVEQMLPFVQPPEEEEDEDEENEELPPLQELEISEAPEDTEMGNAEPSSSSGGA